VIDFGIMQRHCLPAHQIMQAGCKKPDKPTQQGNWQSPFAYDRSWFHVIAFLLMGWLMGWILRINQPIPKKQIGHCEEPADAP
jgi:hypothetical protein